MAKRFRIRIFLSGEYETLAPALRTVFAPHVTSIGHLSFKDGPNELVILVQATTNLVTNATVFGVVLRKLLKEVSKVLGRRKRRVWFDHKGQTYLVRVHGRSLAVTLPDASKKGLRSTTELAKLIRDGRRSARNSD